jgi:hypothetical protein
MCCMTNRFWQVVCPTILLYYFFCSADLVARLTAACVAYRPYSVACFLVYLMTLCQLNKLYGLEWWGVPYNVEGICHTIVFVIPEFAYGNWGELRIIKQSLLLRTDSLKRGIVCCNEQGRNPSSDATRCWFGQENPVILCNLNIYYRIHNCLPIILILNLLFTLSFI